MVFHLYKEVSLNIVFEVKFMDEDIVINCKVISIRPHFDAYGNEFVCVEFGVEAQKPPTIMPVPTNLPPEVSAVIPIISQLPKMFSHGKVYSHRLTIFLSNQEWEKMGRKYQYNDEVEIRISRKDGTIKIVPL
ncbi:MAG: hypothetical protein B6U77_03575 [Candidatus Hecatellales archaeon ex4484_218]|nr:MAG: hypothetical protein B6U77_03575 [Candidatus Hecatellales archaeon ex4484_218]